MSEDELNAMVEAEILDEVMRHKLFKTFARLGLINELLRFFYCE
jgi:hypothetical protein